MAGEKSTAQRIRGYPVRTLICRKLQGRSRIDSMGPLVGRYEDLWKIRRSG